MASMTLRAKTHSSEATPMTQLTKTSLICKVIGSSDISSTSYFSNMSLVMVLTSS